ncbi:Glycosyltransferase 28 domain protein [Caldicellulosiruptor owensensis OL]|uniref:Glycosyltransferase 28 domain protein n=1 Tax=Caldicellulosiruptor owensensis (strain ATCC 700167 / DSM 13100 / OL) TaxID=632518 RepID=E4Q5S6_CALOW|nr:glycosyltransferase [Caldicellulosiruptor owensensis]ADQ05485.1 Glycosyltransferase 28 domain protein [Caldicellulosiruptor owensensis OL]
MIFVTVGTHEQQFNRLLEIIDLFISNGTIHEEVIAQTGYSTYEPQYYKCSRFFSYNDMLDLIKKARIVITHGGPATLFQCWINSKIPIVFPRDPKYKEHVDKHQLFFAERLKKSNLALVAFNEEDLEYNIKNYEEICNSHKILTINSNIAQVVGKYIEEHIIKDIL